MKRARLSLPLKDTLRDNLILSAHVAVCGSLGREDLQRTRENLRLKVARGTRSAAETILETVAPDLNVWDQVVQ